MYYKSKSSKEVIYKFSLIFFVIGMLISPVILSSNNARYVNDFETESDADKIGVLIINYGEPTTFTNETFDDFKAYMLHMMNIGMLPSFLKQIDKGTILTDTKNDNWVFPWQRSLVNAWGETVFPIGLYSKGNENMHTSPHYFTPFYGRGFKEPDIFEQATLTAYHSWINMENYSPYKDQTMPQVRSVIDELEYDFGDSIVCTSAFGFENGSITAATINLLKQNISKLIAAPQMVVESNFEGKFHWYKEIYQTINESNMNIPVYIAEQIGSQPSFVESIVLKTSEEIDNISTNERVYLFLSNHGFPKVKSGSYDCGADPYHDNADRVFQLVSNAISENVSTEKLIGIKKVYAEFAEGSDDPNNEVFSPLEALSTLPAECTYVINIPYGFLGENTDTLNALRDAFDVTGWDNNYETEFFYENNVTVKITTCSFHKSLQKQALYESITAKINTLLNK